MDAARRIVHERDQGVCQMCGRSTELITSSVHHRLNKGNGGSALLERASVLINVCGDGVLLCHGRVTRYPKWAESIGWLLPRNNPDIDPEEEPILTYHGWILLDDFGGRTPYIGETA